MQTRREFLGDAGTIVLGSFILPSFSPSSLTDNPGIQLYTFRKEMLVDSVGTLKLIAQLGFKQIESARSDKGNYYGLKPAEMKKVCSDLGLTVRSGHIHIDDKWKQSLQEAAETGQEYVICSSMPSKGQTIDNYKKTAEAFNKAGEESKQMGLKFGYHNHAYEFEQEGGNVLFDTLVAETDPGLVHLELDLGWVIVGGKNPLDYFKKFPGRFPLWHLKDMDLVKKESTEFGKGGLDIRKMFEGASASGMKYFFVEQEEYTKGPGESMKANMEYLKKLKL